ncbi:MAG: hypothetical protein OEM62_10095 [Acidobacteriota bacterium]|nr:hypothetical protein [Acidobacteriota bacterium]
MVGEVRISFAVYVGLLILVAFQRLAELRLSRRHCRAATAAGAIEYGARHYPWMVLLHSSFLLACGLEVWILERPFVPQLAVVMAVVLLIATGLRYWAIRALGSRWTTRVFAWPDRPLVRSGPYRYLRHPNYVAVALEILALPLLHSAWIAAIVFGVLNIILLSIRITAEEEALSRAPSAVSTGEGRLSP